MAKNIGIIPLSGKLGDYSFYPSKYGNIMRRKGGPSRRRILKGPEFARVRENNSEFGSASTAGRVFRHAVLALSKGLGDGTAAFRLTTAFLNIARCDGHNIRGQRVPQQGLLQEAGRALLMGFSFNSSNSLAGALLRPVAVDTAGGMVEIVGLDPAVDFRAPVGAGHVRLTAGVAQLDLDKKMGALVPSKPVVLALNGPMADVSLSVAAKAGGGPLVVYLLKVEFLQEVNGQLYALGDRGQHVLEVVGVEYAGEALREVPVAVEAVPQCGVLCDTGGGGATDMSSLRDLEYLKSELSNDIPSRWDSGGSGVLAVPLCDILCVGGDAGGQNTGEDRHAVPTGLGVSQIRTF